MCGRELEHMRFGDREVEDDLERVGEGDRILLKYIVQFLKKYKRKYLDMDMLSNYNYMI